LKHALPLHDSHLFGGRRDDVRDILACRDFLERPLNQVSAIGAKFRNFDERVFLLELLSDGSKPGMGIVEREQAFFFGTFDEDLSRSAP
jgi:hypothetical protein